MTSKKIIFPLIMSIITFLIGSFVAIVFLGIQLKGYLLLLLIAYLPFIIYLTNTMIIYLIKEGRRLVNFALISSIVITSTLWIYYIIAIFPIALISAMYPVTNTVFYKKIINDLNTPITDVFPKKIPKEVENVKFHYNTSFLMGSELLYLYYIDKDMTDEKFDKEYKDKSIWIGNYKEKKEISGGYLLEFSKDESYKRENDFTIYLFDQDCDDSGYCNHGIYILAGFNEKTKEIIYKYEHW